MASEPLVWLLAAFTLMSTATNAGTCGPCPTDTSGSEVYCDERGLSTIPRNCVTGNDNVRTLWAVIGSSFGYYCKYLDSMISPPPPHPSINQFSTNHSQLSKFPPSWMPGERLWDGCLHRRTWYIFFYCLHRSWLVYELSEALCWSIQNVLIKGGGVIWPFPLGSRGNPPRSARVNAVE